MNRIEWIIQIILKGEITLKPLKRRITIQHSRNILDVWIDLINICFYFINDTF